MGGAGQSGKHSKGEWEISRNAPVEEDREAVSPEKGGLHPWRGSVFQQGKELS